MTPAKSKHLILLALCAVLCRSQEETALEDVKVSNEILKTLKASSDTSTQEDWKNL